jgi:pimeloyl-ACP methyl ester carboxylesterase
MPRARSRAGTAIAFDRSGEGPPIILVGGAFQARSAPKMTLLAELIAPRFTVISYDRRGRGESEDTEPYSVEREIEDLDALIGEAGGSACLFGMSSGGVLALEAVAQGLQIERVAVYDPPFMVDDSAPRPPVDHQAQLTALISAGTRRPPWSSS